jgi:hypothetical protein
MKYEIQVEDVLQEAVPFVYFSVKELAAFLNDKFDSGWFLLELSTYYDSANCISGVAIFERANEASHTE